jgi:uncharacterized membrane protein YeaQ/YmgE (transglycosylase-associated protein family)
MNGAAPELSGAHAATMKSAAGTEPATSTTAGKRVIWDQTGSDENGCREADETVTNHGHPPDLGVPWIRSRKQRCPRQRRPAPPIIFDASLQFRLT